MTKIYYNSYLVVKFVYEAPHLLSITYLTSDSVESNVKTVSKVDCAKVLSQVQVVSNTFGNTSGINFVNQIIASDDMLVYDDILRTTDKIIYRLFSDHLCGIAKYIQITPFLGSCDMCVHTVQIVEAISRICYYSNNEDNSVYSIMKIVRVALRHNLYTVYIKCRDYFCRVDINPEIQGYLTKLEFLGVKI